MRRQGGSPGGEPQSKGTLASASCKCAGLCSCGQAGVMEHPSEALESQHLSKQACEDCLFKNVGFLCQSSRVTCSYLYERRTFEFLGALEHNITI